MTESSASLVSVVVPAFNAQATLEATLNSVRSQTHCALEIVVVDDGSSDNTAAVAEEHAARDPRVRVVRQANSGVAAARNRGIAETSGRYIAPIDADDLWAPTKIEKQLSEMLKAPGTVALVYTWTANIDAAGFVTSYEPAPIASGDCLAAMCYMNLVGSGSSPLLLREAVDHAGGFDESLRTRRAEGCEDYKMYLQIAENYEFGLVPEYLTGYRIVSGNMSSDAARMIRSRDICSDFIVERHPELADIVRRGRAWRLRSMLSRAISDRRADAARFVLVEMFRHDSAFAMRQLAALAAKATTRSVRRLTKPRRAAAARVRFAIGRPN